MKVFWSSLADDLNQHTLSTPAVKLAIEDLLPWSEVEFAIGDGYNNFATHDLPFQMGVGVVFAGSVVVILRSWRVWRELLQPNFVVMQQTAFVIVYEYCRSDVHGVDKTKPLADAALTDEFFDRAGDVHEAATPLYFKPKMFGQGFHMVIQRGTLARATPK